MTVFSTQQQPSTPTTEQALQQALEKVLQLAVRHHQSGRIEEAESLYRSILQTQPDHPEANHNLGRLAVQTQQPGTGLPYFAAALEANPGEAEYWISYLDALLQAGEMDMAQQVLALGRQHGLQGEDVDVLAGRVEMHAQRAEQSDAVPAGSVEVAGTTAKQNDNTRTKIVPAAKPARQAVSGKGKSIASKQETDTLVMLYKQRRFAEMETLARSLTQRFPRHGFGWKALGVVLLEQGRTREALAPAQKGVELLPGDVDAYVNLGVVLQRQGRLAEAQTSYRRALQIKPDYALPYSNLLFCLSHDERVDAAALFAEHVRFGDQFEAPLRAGWPQHRNTREPQRRLQIGIVSADLRNHAVAHFIEPVLAQWASDPGLALHAYYTFPTEDGDTQRLRGYVAHWHAVAGLNDAALAERIRADGIDILLDLSGHTAGNRLPVFARKPAPLQVSWIGYAGTTGLQAMDYYLADRHFLPPGRFDNQFTEKIVQLPGGTPFLPAADAPPVNALPALANGHVTFGSFNRLNKLSQPVIALWSQLLRAVPESRMVLGAMPEDGVCDALLGWFAQEGIARERLTLHARCGMRAYLTLHHQVDICLDTFPYNGGTTTLHALWMGVPTLTLAGGTPAGRSGAAVLGHAGLEEFVAQEAGEFVAKGVCWAGDLAALAELRSGLREQYAHSARGQSALVAASVADALRMMWQRWCAGQPAASFEVSLDTVRAVRQRGAQQAQVDAPPLEKAMPDQQEINTLAALYGQRRFAEVETLARSFTQRFPQHEFGWKVLGSVLDLQGRSGEALAPTQRAAELSPRDAQAHSNLGIILQRQGLQKEAEASYRKALEIQPDYVDVHNNLGIVLKELGRFPEAEASYRRALELKPDYADAYGNLGILLRDQGQLAEAEASFRRLLEIKPDDVETHGNLGNTLKELGRLPEAEASYRRLLQIKPDYAEAHFNLGIVLDDCGRLREAEANYRRALEIKPDYAEAHYNLGNALKNLGRLPEAQASYRRSLVLKPDYAEAHNNLGNVLKEQGQLAEAEASYRRALQIRPDYAYAHSNLLFCMAHDERVDAAALFAEHVRFGRQFEAPLRAGWPQHRNTREPQRCLQIGVVSADLRNHAVAHFIEPVLAQWASDPGLALHAYYTFPTEDGDTQRLRGYVAHWHAVAGLNDAALAERIRADGIDILLDLSGHTAGNRLPVFARKPAPLQASWIGYAGTTGLQAMDYYLADRHFLPPGRFDSQFTEKIVQLPGGTPFLPTADAPPVNALPALANGHLTFGSFNRLNKLSQPVIALWSQLLRAVPESRMVLGAMPEDGACDVLLGWFAQEGIARERLTLHARCGMRAYLTLHHQVDICLDTFPYNGGTTTLHALWMGVPTLTLAGGTPAGRSGAAVLGHAGLEEFVAQEAGEFVAKGVCWAGNLAALAELRSGLRERYAHSAKGQSALVAANVADALRMMWQRWCAGQTPVSFTVALEADHATRQKGRLAEALAPMQTASELLPDDAEAHSDPGIILTDIRRSDAETASVASNAGQALEKILQLAFSHHQSGHIEEAESLYRSILQMRPDHPQANHHLGLLVVQAQQPGAGLPYLAAALEADPVESRYWLSYIDALILADEADTARQVLELGRQHGLAGAEVEALAERLKECVQNVAQPDAASTAVATPPAVSQNGKKPASAKAVPKAQAVRQAASGNGAGIAPSQEEVNTLVALYNDGRFVEMEAMAGSFTQRFPKHGFGWKALGAVLQQQGRIADALAPMQTAVELLPGDAEAHTNLGIVLQHHGRVAEAEASLRRALRLKPDLAAAHFNLGNTLNEQNRLPEAEASFRRALQIKPDYVEAHINLGVIAEDLERLSEAEASYRKALEIRPDDAKVHGHLGTLLKDLVRLPEAEASLRQALVLKPDYAEVHSNLGIVLQSQGRLAEAEASLRRALELKPDYAEAHNNLGIVLKGLGRLPEAEASYRRSLTLKPNYAEAHNNLGNVLKDQGRLVDAEASYRRALQLKPDYAYARSNLLFCLTHDERVDAAALFAEHCRFGDQFEAPLRAGWPQHGNTREPQRCLQVALVSADLRNHAVAHFIEPVLAQWASDPELALHAYYTHPTEDGDSLRLRGYMAHWHAVAGLSDAALAERIRADGIDILLDLSGHTAGNRLLTFARKPAPLQASWLGYPGTTGLQAMDYQLADRYFLPPGQFDAQFTEKIVHLPAGVPFLPIADAPPVNMLPALANGHVTFGSFNRPSKLSLSVIALWAQLLRALPDSRMVLGAMPEDGGYDTLLDWFAREGIARERLSLHARCGMRAYLELHGQVDVCLDTFPYNGGTTTLHALWMGVPTLMLVGRTVPGRAGVAGLSHAGLEAFIAQDAAEFVEKGVLWAGDLGGLAKVRAGLRERFAQSAMGQPALVAAGMKGALRAIWQRWCAGQPAASFEISEQDIGITIHKDNK